MTRSHTSPLLGRGAESDIFLLRRHRQTNIRIVYSDLVLTGRRREARSGPLPRCFVQKMGLISPKRGTNFNFRPVIINSAKRLSSVLSFSPSSHCRFLFLTICVLPCGWMVTLRPQNHPAMM